MLFGKALHPIHCGFDISIGNGLVLPEVNYTLPPMKVSKETKSEVLQQYKSIVINILSRMVILDAPGVVLEFEHAPQMTEDVSLGAEITHQTKTIMDEFYQNHQLKSALRVTICDIREQERPPRIRTGKSTELVFRSFEENAKAGADMLSIESIGGKEIHDKALMEADVGGILLALGVLGPIDMHFLWRNISRIADKHHVICAGDTACGFANTAMVLADKNYIPSVLAGVVRAVSAVRSLVAFEEGAVGPSKDCGYEGPVIKAITGLPISMEGKSAACAHFSHLGNIAAAVCDLWSNESVQNVKLLSGFAPEVFSEILAYDCRLMNTALARKEGKQLRDMFVESDINKSVHAYIISPQCSFEIAKSIISGNSDFERAHKAGLKACELIREGIRTEQLRLSERELTWLEMIEEQISFFDQEEKVLEHGMTAFKTAFLPEEYGIDNL